MWQRGLIIGVSSLLLMVSLSIQAETNRSPDARVYLILDITVHDPDTYAQYREKVEQFVKSPEYQAIVHLRTSSSSTKSVLVNGYQPSN